MQHVDRETALARKIFAWTLGYAVIFGFAVWLIIHSH